MTDTILLLRMEHHNAADLLTLIERQLERDDEMDLKLLKSVADYFIDYPEQCHHPVEDLVFRKLRARDASRAAKVEELLEDHRAISELTRRFAQVLEEPVVDAQGRTTDLREVLRQFVDHYRRHMSEEEKVFFPAALAALTVGDWAEIEYDLFDRKDPLFDPDVEDRFRMLREEIEAQSKRSDQRSRFKRQILRLRRLDGVQAFNDLMTKADLDYCLVEHPDGSYGLERDGRVVTDIPECNPSRAAWCAHFYVQAATGQTVVG